MDTSVRVFDDGAWISVGGDRAVGVADVWRLDAACCDCDRSDVLVEAFEKARREDGIVEARTVGRCLDCGASGRVGWVRVGHVDEDGFAVAERPARVE
ncbi:hypothetical protein GCM10027435_06300 [Haloparvum alkalitolerans]|uniref:hypothetical protein n=1 Tax=Haloparvum alkalitolerans TaxID=1042953 RepID=UPI003CF7E5ED